MRISYNDIYGSESVPIPPIVFLRLSDRQGETTFEYEVPINFKLEKSASHNFVSIKIVKGNWIGFTFKRSSDFDELCSNFEELKKQLTYDLNAIEELKKHAEKL